MGFGSDLKHAWSVLRGKNEILKPEPYNDVGPSYTYRTDRPIARSYGSQKDIVSSIYTRIAIDVAATDIRHVKLDEEDRFQETIKSQLNRCLNTEANIDQAARMFKQDIIMSLFEHGVIAIVPVDTTLKMVTSDGGVDTKSFDVKTLRVGRITSFYPRHVRVELYNDKKGIKEEVLLPKEVTAIVENPLYAVMNEPNSYLQRLLRALNRMDAIDEQISSGKIDLIVHLPYVVKGETRENLAKKKRQDLEEQLKGSQYGVGYVDSTDKITQLNRPVENTMLDRVEYLMNTVHSQMGLTPEVFNGTADEKTMLNYHNRTIEPLLAAVAEAMKRAFLSKTAQSQGQSIEYYRDPFKLISIGEVAELADKFTRNEIASSNEMRGAIGMTPSKDPKADELRNSNIPQAKEDQPTQRRDPDDDESW